MSRPRGRPRKFDETKALEAAAQVFWRKGFDGTSLDDLAAAMEMNRPSIYGAFGDKETIYRRALGTFVEQMQAASTATLFGKGDIRKSLKAFYKAALEVYTTGDDPLGCMVMSTATCTAPTHPDVLSDLQTTLNAIDESFKQRLELAVSEGELDVHDLETRAQLAQALLHTLSIRARAGESKKQLTQLVNRSIELILSES